MKMFAPAAIKTKHVPYSDVLTRVNDTYLIYLYLAEAQGIHRGHFYGMPIHYGESVSTDNFCTSGLSLFLMT